MLSEVHPAHQTGFLPEDLVALELEVAFPSDEEAPEPQLEGQADGFYVLNLNR